MKNLSLSNVKCKFCSKGVNYAASLNCAGKLFCSDMCIDMYKERNQQDFEREVSED